MSPTEAKRVILLALPQLPLASCSSAEPTSVSLGRFRVTDPMRLRKRNASMVFYELAIGPTGELAKE